jgi:8-amino-7-oxononanoate synthase
MFKLNQTPGRTALVDGKEFLFFSGYSYLGMSHVPEFVELVKRGIVEYGWLFPSSRISNTQLDLFSQFETKLSEISGMEETVCFSSGFLAGRAVADLYKDKPYSCAPGAHPAICLEKTTDDSFNEWKEKALRFPVIYFDSVNPLTAEINDISFLDDLSTNTTCIIDDSHGAGLLSIGKGSGVSLGKKKNIDYVLTYSLSKAYNLVGGAVSCSKEIAAQLRASPFYTASTSISPAFAYAFLNAQELYQQQREKLKNNIQRFRELTNDRFKSHPQLPIFILPSHLTESKFAKAGIIISSFAYPDPKGEHINRVVLNALHKKKHLELLAYTINNI